MGLDIFPPARWTDQDWTDATLLVFVTCVVFALASQYTRRRPQHTPERLRIISDRLMEVGQ